MCGTIDAFFSDKNTVVSFSYGATIFVLKSGFIFWYPFSAQAAQFILPASHR
jgi:hypothetical protein